MTWAVLCDFDHTITTEDVTDTILERYALPEWRQTEALWEKGIIGSGECMREQIGQLRATPEQVDAIADDIHVDTHFAEFAALCSSRNIPLVIVSDGLDYVIERVLNRHKIPHAAIIAAHLEHTGENRWQLKTPYADASCSSKASTCKCQVAQRLRLTTGAEKILYIGDGRSDYCVSMQEADFILAKASLLNYCEQNKLLHQPFQTFAQASGMLAQLLRETPVIPKSKDKEPRYA